MRRVLSILLTTVILTACQTVPPTTPAPSPLPSFSPSPAPSETPAPTLTPTLTATSTPEPTATPTLTPTATPQGYLSLNAGFSMIASADWEVSADTSRGAVLANQKDLLLFVASNSMIEESFSFEALLDQLLDELSIENQNVKLQSQEEINLGGKTPAQKAVITAQSPEGVDIGIQVIYLEQKPKFYTFTVIGQLAVLEQRELTLARMFDTIRLESSQTYGLSRNQTLTLLGYDPDPEDLDPAVAMGSAEDYAGSLFSGLVRLTPQMQIEPDLAESYSVSPDGTVYTFTLRSNLAFENGSPLTAEDVKYSWERAANPEMKSNTVSTYLGDIIGVKDKLEGSADEIAGVQVVDDQTLVVRLDGPKPYFLAKLSYPTSFVVDRENVESSPDFWMYDPNASGPFGLKEYREEDALILERNPAYHTPAKLANIVYLLNRAGASISYYEAGEVDITGLDVASVKRVQDPADPLHDQLVSTPNLCVRALHFSNNMPPLDDINVRKALALSIDRDRLVELITENLQLRADGILPPAMPGYSADLTIGAFDPGAARAALEDSKYAGDLPEIVLTLSGYADTESQMINAITSMWEETLGVKVRVEYIEPRVFTEQARENHGQIVNFGWCADYPDPENFLDVLFYTGNDFNVAGYSNPAVDALLEDARVELSPATRLSLYNQAEAALLEDFALLPLFNSISYTLVSPRLQGFTATGLGVAIWHLVWLEEP